MEDAILDGCWDKSMMWGVQCWHYRSTPHTVWSNLWYLGCAEANAPLCLCGSNSNYNISHFSWVTVFIEYKVPFSPTLNQKLEICWPCPTGPHCLYTIILWKLPVHASISLPVSFCSSLSLSLSYFLHSRIASVHACLLLKWLIFLLLRSMLWWTFCIVYKLFSVSL